MPGRAIFIVENVTRDDSDEFQNYYPIKSINI